jgi:hypothetical protein
VRFCEQSFSYLLTGANWQFKENSRKTAENIRLQLSPALRSRPPLERMMRMHERLKAGRYRLYAKTLFVGCWAFGVERLLAKGFGVGR